MVRPRLEFPVDNMAVYAIGDIHGYTMPLRQLLSRHRFSSEDTVVFLGDYVDKGPDVAGTLQVLSELATSGNFVFLRGNHDQLLIDAFLDPEKIAVWECLAGGLPLASYGSGSTADLLRTLPVAHTDFLINRCRDYYEIGGYIMVHGGIRPHLAPAEEDQEHLQWLTLSAAAAHLSGRTVVCGHSAQATGQIVDLGHTICIDTGITDGTIIEGRLNR
jgi:serine/threonine protein phosphatase 1